jgi:hypothetical protein
MAIITTIDEVILAEAAINDGFTVVKMAHNNKTVIASKCC